MVVSTRHEGNPTAPPAGAERAGPRKGRTKRPVVDLRRPQNAVHEDNQGIATDEELLKGTRCIHDHRQLLQMNCLQPKCIIRLKYTGSTLQCIVSNIIEVSLSRREKDGTYLS